MNADLEKLQGIWNIETLEVEGAAMSQAGAGSQIVVRGETFTTISMGEQYNGTIKVDDSRKPKTLDLLFTEGPHAGKVSQAIYELDGDDWKICLCFAGGIRPKEFVTEVGSGHALETLKRQTSVPSLVEKSRNMTRHPVARFTGRQGELLEFQGEWIIVSAVQSGESFPANLVQSGKRVVRGNETTVTFGGQVYLKATLTLDNSTNPKSIDYLVMIGPQKGKVLYGIYDFAGDTNRLCFAALGADRPTRFESTSGDGRTLTIWKKAQK